MNYSNWLIQINLAGQSDFHSGKQRANHFIQHFFLLRNNRTNQQFGDNFECIQFIDFFPVIEIKLIQHFQRDTFCTNIANIYWYIHIHVRVVLSCTSTHTQFLQFRRRLCLCTWKVKINSHSSMFLLLSVNVLVVFRCIVRAFDWTIAITCTHRHMRLLCFASSSSFPFELITSNFRTIQRTKC